MTEERDETAIVALQLIIGLLSVIKAKRMLEPHELEMVFESALAGAETSSPSAPSNRQRQRLERIANQIASLPEINAGDQKSDQNHP